ncbi:AAA family ATPase [Candidatus Micrarchaeota archaeon]|nr:AAA family ATPase [Candidatus Micrarchaeota archaeon]
MITRLVLRNFRSHEYTDLEFRRGVNLLIGIVGSGKSSVLEAISYALFGAVPQKLKLNQLIRHGCNGLDVGMEFTIDDINYKVKRSYKNNKNYAELYDGNGLIAEGVRAVNNEIVKILGVDYDLFSKAVYSEQNRIDYFLNLQATQRKKEIDNLLGLERFEKLRTNTKKVINRIKDRINYLDSLLDEQKYEELLKNFEQTNKSINEINAKINDYNEQLDLLLKKTKELELKYMSMKEKRDEWNRLNSKRDKLIGLLGQLNVEIKNKPKFDIKSIKLKNNELELLRKDIHEELQVNNLQLEKINNEIGGLVSKLNHIKKLLVEKKELEKIIRNITGGEDISTLERHREILNNEIDQLITNISKYKLNIEKNQKVVSELKSAGTNCPVCGSRLDEVHKKKLINDSEIAIEEEILFLNENKKIFEDKKKELEKLSDSINLYHRTMDRINIIQKDLLKKDELLGMLKEFKDKKESVNNVINELSDKENAILNQLNEHKNILQRVERYEKYLNEYQVKRKEFDDVEDGIKNLNYDESLFNIISKDYQEAEKRYEKLKIIINSYADKKESLEEISRMYKKQIDKYEKNSNLRKSYIEKLEFFNRLLSAIIETQIETRINLVEAINVEMSNMWNEIYPYGDYTSVRINAEDGYTPELYNGEWKSYTYLSGGERSCLALALRIALSIVLTNNLSWLILDEPTHNLDTEMVETLSETLKRAINNLVNQTFIISHDESFIRSDYDKIYLFKRDKSKQGPTQVEVINENP